MSRRVLIAYTGGGRLASVVCAKLKGLFDAFHLMGGGAVEMVRMKPGDDYRGIVAQLSGLSEGGVVINLIDNLFKTNEQVDGRYGYQVGLMALATKAMGGRFLHLSSHEVFTGWARADYEEPNPGSSGFPFWMAERAVMSAIDDHKIVRTGRLFGMWPEREIEAIAVGRLKDASGERTTYTCAWCMSNALVMIAAFPELLPERVIHVSQHPPITAAELTGAPQRDKKVFHSGEGLIPTEGMALPPVAECYEKLVSQHSSHREGEGSRNVQTMWVPRDSDPSHFVSIPGGKGSSPESHQFVWKRPPFSP